MSLQKSVKSAGGDRSEQGDTTSICSSVTTQPDRHGFFGGAQYSPEPKRTVSPSTILKREQKWLRMLDNWEAFMNKNYKKVRERCRKGKLFFGL
ncbi:TBC1 domain family member 10B [Phthorimaea operculella]|nr:TBC1 domain family member 10B [Phthorimaea operculella]